MKKAIYKEVMKCFGAMSVLGTMICFILGSCLMIVILLTDIHLWWKIMLGILVGIFFTAAAIGEIVRVVAKTRSGF